MPKTLKNMNRKKGNHGVGLNINNKYHSGQPGNTNTIN